MSGMLERPHLIGVGGAGMSGVARILLGRGVPVSGSDAKESRTVLALRAQGVRLALGQAAENLDLLGAPPSVVVMTSAIRESNPELAAARARGIPVLHRAEALAELMADRVVACVTGTHGKTSTTSMLTVALQRCGRDPSFAIGGDLNDSGANAHHGLGEIFVAEADESDGSFLAFSPRVAVVTNVEADHLDYHGSLSAYVGAFDEFVRGIAPGGVLVACADDPGSAALAARAEAAGLRVRRYGFAASGEADAVLTDHRAQPGPEQGYGSVTSVRLRGATYELRISVPGRHMAVNAAAALLAGCELGADVPDLLSGLAAFGGVRRRFEFKGSAAGVRVYDDYAHNPTKVAAQLAACRLVAGQGRLVVVFQPHLYSRTRDFAERFGEALAGADEVVVLDVYGAREDPQPGVTGGLIAERVPLPPSRVHYEPAFDRLPVLVASLVSEGDLVVTMGAGDVTMLGPEILTELDRSGEGVGAPL
jgi:UDP-N-acetylmuramate--alanine ligase